MKKAISIILLIAILCICTISEASSFSASLTTEKKEVKAGEVISIKLNVSNIEMSNGLMALSGKLIYDEEIFEAITTNNMGGIVSTSLSKINGLGSWSSPTYTSVTKMFVLDANDYITEASGVVEIQLKVKSDISEQETTVRVTDIVASNGEEDIPAQDVSITLNVKKATGEGGGQNNPGNNEGEENPGNGGQNNPGNGSNNGSGNQNNGNGSNSGNGNRNNGSTNKDNTTAKEPIPQTGRNIVYRVIVVLAGLLIATTSYIKYKKIIVK